MHAGVVVGGEAAAARVVQSVHVTSNFRRSEVIQGDANLLDGRHDLLLGESLELFSRVPDIDDADTVTRYRRPMKERPPNMGGTRAPMTNRFNGCVVLVSRRSGEVDVHCNSHANSPSLGRTTQSGWQRTNNRSHKLVNLPLPDPLIGTRHRGHTQASSG